MLRRTRFAKYIIIGKINIYYYYYLKKKYLNNLRVDLVANINVLELNGKKVTEDELKISK